MSNTRTINGIEFDLSEDLTLRKSRELNTALGTDGEPKYSEGQMKSRTKAQLADELRDLLLSLPAPASEKPKRTRKAKGEPTARVPRALTVSKTKDVAASKLCLLLKAVAAGKKTIVDAENLFHADPVFADYLKGDLALLQTKVENAANGTRPKQLVRAGAVIVDLETGVAEPAA